MALKDELIARSGGACELCGGTERTSPWTLPPTERDAATAGTAVLLCGACRFGAAGEAPLEGPGWRLLGDAVWSEVAPVKALAWRMLHRVEGAWGQDLLDVAYLDEETMALAVAGMPVEEEDTGHVDAHGARLAAGDTVTLTKDLNVKGTGFTAKRGTAVRGISPVPDNPGQIEGKVNGQTIVILTQFVKKSG